jgi:hypothetical protein
MSKFKRNVLALKALTVVKETQNAAVNYMAQQRYDRGAFAVIQRKKARRLELFGRRRSLERPGHAGVKKGEDLQAQR